jgi:hypothetical protein
MKMIVFVWLSLLLLSGCIGDSYDIKEVDKRVLKINKSTGEVWELLDSEFYKLSDENGTLRDYIRNQPAPIEAPSAPAIPPQDGK